jgi:hypothetical protein
MERTRNIADVWVEMYDYRDGPVKVPLFQLVQWRSALKLEAQGMRHSSGSVTAQVRKLLKCPKSQRAYSNKALIAYLEATIADVREQLAER